MTRPFTVTCYRFDVGIFTVYGARIKQNKMTYPYPPKAVNNNPVPQNPRFIDRIYYDVVLFTNPDLDQSISAYRSNDKHLAEIYLDNFITLCSRGYRYIDLAKITDKPMKCPCPPPPPMPGPFAPYFDGKQKYEPCFNKHDIFEPKIPDCEIDPRYLNNPRKNPYYDCFEEITRKPEYAKQPYDYYDKNCFIPRENNFNCKPKYDGEIIDINKNCCHPFPPKPFPPVPPCPPPQPEPPIPPYPYYPPCPPPPKPYPCPCPPKEKIVIYYGNGGFAMGESVVDNIKELAPNALRTMICKNFHPTFFNMNPPDKIVVKKAIYEFIPPTETFKTNMDIAGEWSFFMIPDKFYKLVEDYNWYYKEDTIDGKWFELDKTIPQTTFSFQDNGIRYWVNAVRLNGRYDMRFAKTGRDFNSESKDNSKDYDNIDLDIDMKFAITIHIDNYSEKEYTSTIEDLSVTNQVIRTLNGFIDDEISWHAIENHVYELKVYKKEDKENAIVTRYFIAIPDENYNHGFCTWVADTYVSETPISTQFTKVIDLQEPKTASSVNRIVITSKDITE